MADWHGCVAVERPTRDSLLGGSSRRVTTELSVPVGDAVAIRATWRDPLGTTAKDQVTGGSFDLTTIVPIGHPRRIGLFAKLDLPKYLRG